jgi:signal transduction histidine kinase
MMTEKPKILVVDDNTTNLSLVGALLAGLNIELMRATSGPEAIDLTNREEFALVLMDISMPGMDGFETVEKIRVEHKNKLLNIIYMTALSDEPDLQIRGVKTGAVDFISKPVSRELLIGKVNIFINLYKQHKSLEEEIRRRVAAEEELIRAREVAEDAAMAKQQFLSVMSHEIRTPLNAIINTTHFLYEAHPRPDQMDNLGVLRFSATTLLQLVNSILEYSKIDSGKIEFEINDFEIRELATGIRKSLEPEATPKGLDLHTYIDEKVPPVVRGDCGRLSQILMNLLGNAVKFTETGHVSLSVGVINDLPDVTEIGFRVADTGIGIPPEQQDKIFERYTQGSQETVKKYGGTGLGLSITKMLVELQGGKLELQSDPAFGSTFSFSLKFNKSNKRQLQLKKPGNAEQKSMKGMKILVAEDNIVNQKIVLKILTKWEATPDIAENGRIAVEKIRENHYNLVLMDLHMPEMDGYEATQAIRKMEGEYFRHLPIIALTATAFAEERSKIRSFGMNGYLIKPFTPPELYSKISHFIK